MEKRGSFDLETHAEIDKTECGVMTKVELQSVVKP